ncbi:PHD finger protein 20 [Liparis tanakae]|uniref:PHD finger protein 20 n=1 Tax=Liparis tanakae TaxID=230148 RepID=A0A4Z2GFD1_9TELE|nr:PHD finger protein 20 [Liparis tanakae]
MQLGEIQLRDLDQTGGGGGTCTVEGLHGTSYPRPDKERLEDRYAANIEKIDYETEKVLVHYRQWSHRYDEWFDWASTYLRPVERVQLRRQGLHDDAPDPGFNVNDKFYDGVIQSVKGIHVKPFTKEVNVKTRVSIHDTCLFLFCPFRQLPLCSACQQSGGGKSQSSDSNMVRRAPNRRDRRPQENGGPKSKRARRSTSDREEDSNSEAEERLEGGMKNKKTNFEAAPTIKQEEDTSEISDPNKPADADKGTGLANGVKAEEDESGGGGERDEERCRVNGEVKKEEAETEQSGTKPYAAAAAAAAPKPYPELPSQTPAQIEQAPVAMTTAASNGDAEPTPSVQSESAAPAADAPPPQPVKPVRKQGFHNPNRFSREPREYPNAYRHRFAFSSFLSLPFRVLVSVYRVIKNQPPPVLSINLDHNPFKCGAPGCTKSFRKAKLLHYHMKYYHGEEQPAEGERSPTRSVQTRASEKQTAPAGSDGPKRRRTISASMHSVGPAAAPRGEVKAAGRRTSAPPAVNSQGHQQRALLREKSKENQLDRNGCHQPDKDSDRSGFDVGSVKDKLREKPKQKDFLRIKLKKKKKKKKAKSGKKGVPRHRAPLSPRIAYLLPPPPCMCTHCGVVDSAPPAPLGAVAEAVVCGRSVASVWPLVTPSRQSQKAPTHFSSDVMPPRHAGDEKPDIQYIDNDNNLSANWSSISVPVRADDARYLPRCLFPYYITCFF